MYVSRKIITQIRTRRRSWFYSCVIIHEIWRLLSTRFKAWGCTCLVSATRQPTCLVIVVLYADIQCLRPGCWKKSYVVPPFSVCTSWIGEYPKITVLLLFKRVAKRSTSPSWSQGLVSVSLRDGLLIVELLRAGQRERDSGCWAGRCRTSDDHGSACGFRRENGQGSRQACDRWRALGSGDLIAYWRKTQTHTTAVFVCTVLAAHASWLNNSVYCTGGGAMIVKSAACDCQTWWHSEISGTLTVYAVRVHRLYSLNTW